MRTALLAFMKKPTTIIGIVTALMFQLIFSIIWMTGYDGVTDRTDQLRIAIVNEADGMGQQVINSLSSQLPFSISVLETVAAANKQLNDRDIHMVMHIPEEFTARLSGEGNNRGEPASISYWINESNPALIKSIMSGAAVQITAELNRQAVRMGIQSAMIQLNMPEEQAVAASRQLSERVSGELHATHVVQGMNNQMVPMMMVLASYVGAMIMGMNFEQSSLALSATVGKWRRLAARGLLTTVAAVLVSLVGTSLLAALGGQIEGGFLQLWLFQLLFLLVFMHVSQMFLYMFGVAGMVFNIIFLSLQLVSSGAMVPRELLSDFYIGFSQLLPATYAVNGSMSILFGGPGIVQDVLALLAIGGVAALVSIIAVGVKGGGLVRQP